MAFFQVVVTGQLENRLCDTNSHFVSSYDRHKKSSTKNAKAWKAVPMTCDDIVTSNHGMDTTGHPRIESHALLSPPLRGRVVVVVEQ